MLKKMYNNFWVKFIGKTVFYLMILLALYYLYDFCAVNSGGFIYNEF